MARRIKKGKITHISLVSRGANQAQVLYKSDADRIEIDTLMKYDDERGELLALVYPVERFDSDNDIASGEVVKQMCHDFIPNGAMLDLDHDLKALTPDQAQVAENFLVQKGDPRFEGWKDYDGNDLDATGGWATVIKLNSDELRAKARAGEIGGVSMYGTAVMETIKSDSIPNALAHRLSGNHDGDTDMKIEELNEALTKSNDSLVTKIVDGLVKVLKPEPKSTDKIEKTDDKIEFEGDPTNADDLAKHADKVVFASCDMSTSEGVAKWQKHLADKEAALKKAEDDKSTDDEAKLKELEKSNPALAKAMRDKADAEARLAKLEKGSNAPATDDNDDESLSKVEKGMKRGQEIAKRHNERRDVLRFGAKS